MDVIGILEQLRGERDQLDETIMALERLGHTHKRRGRPPAWLAAARQKTQSEPAKRRGRPPGSKNKPKED